MCASLCVCVCFHLSLYRQRPKIFREYGQSQCEKLDPSETTVHHEEELTALYGSAFRFRPVLSVLYENYCHSLYDFLLWNKKGCVSKISTFFLMNNNLALCDEQTIFIIWHALLSFTELEKLIFLRPNC